MLKLIEHQHRLVDLFHGFKECLHLAVMQFMHLALLVIYRTVTQLQELPGQHTRRSRCHPVIFRHLEQLFPLQRVIGLLGRFIKLHGDLLCDAVRQFQIVRRFHADTDIRYLAEYHLIRAGFQLVAPHLITVALVRQEIHIPVNTDRPAQPLPAIKQEYLAPEVSQPMRGRGSGQFNQPLDFRPYRFQGSEPLRFGVFETGGFIQHHTVKRPLQTNLFHQPLHVVPVDHVNIRITGKRGQPFFFRSQYRFDT